MKKKILYILSHPIQYQSPLLKKMSERPEIELKVLYLTNHTLGGKDKQFGVNVQWDTPLLEGYNYEFIKNNSSKPAVSGSFWGLMNFSIVKKVRQEKPDIVIVHGWAYFTNWFLFIFSFRMKAKLWMRAESPLNQELLKRPFVLALKKFILKLFVFRKVDTFLYIGKQNKAFYKFFGVPERKLLFAPYAVDNDHFRNEFKKLQNSKADLRKELNIPENAYVFLTVGKYMSKKRPLDIVTAFQKLQDPTCFLVMLGEGALRKEMEQKIQKENIQNVLLTGFVNQSKISSYYIAADSLVLVSTVGETWGLVLNEAMNFDLPIICSDMPGSAYDLVEHTKNGFVFKTSDINELSAYMKQIKINNLIQNNVAEISSLKMGKFSYKTIIDNIIKHLKTL
jgi:glycosyltransferase involved in cell wall biosynthesis